MSAIPLPYQRQQNFSAWQANHPTDPLPGFALDAEFNAVHDSLLATQERLALLQREDGQLHLLEVIETLTARIAALEARL